ncbi:MAG: hypothetical protein IAI49_05445 [Candidatus Eremiobacteraeota bacterium]|nr:hypothetical protein [Candidatus Eremiobacteraeota bacterium]
MATPWSAPSWMKTAPTLFGGGLRSAAYAAYAHYLVAYVRALENRGISLDALTPQNEPLVNSGQPAMTMTAADEAAFVKTALGPAMSAAFPAIKLLNYDGNWDQTAYPLAILEDGEASQYIAGSAFHCYAGNVSQMSDVHKTFPLKDIYLSECGGGSWAPIFADNLSWNMQNLVIGGTNNWARTIVFWNIALDDNAGPRNHGCTNCRGVVTIHGDGTISRNVEFYVLAHIAKFVRPGATRIASSSSLGNALPNVAFVNSDGSKVLIAFNNSSRSASFVVRFHNDTFSYTLPRGAAVTFHWS